MWVKRKSTLEYPVPTGRSCRARDPGRWPPMTSHFEHDFANLGDVTIHYVTARQCSLRLLKQRRFFRRPHPACPAGAPQLRSSLPSAPSVSLTSQPTVSTQGVLAVAPSLGSDKGPGHQSRGHRSTPHRIDTMQELKRLNGSPPRQTRLAKGIRAKRQLVSQRPASEHGQALDLGS